MIGIKKVPGFSAEFVPEIIHPEIVTVIAGNL